MTVRASDVNELVRTLHDVVVTRSGCWRRKEAHEIGKIGDVIEYILVCEPSDIENAVRRRNRRAIRRLIPLGIENQVRDSHFHVIRLSGEQEERLVLGFQAEAGYGAVISVPIQNT